MLLSKLLTPLALLAPALVVGRTVKSSDKVDIVASWPKTNVFGSVTNGNLNLLNLQLSNHAGEELVVTGVKGEFREAGGKERVIRQTTHLPLRQPVASGQKSPIIPYRFHSENKIGEVGLRVFVEFADSGKKQHSVLAYDDVVNVVEPPTSWFDLELLSVYAILAALLSLAGYLLYGSFLAPSPSKSSKKRSPTSASTGKSTAVVATSDIIDGDDKKLDEDFIPPHHLKQRKASGKGYASATSGEESEGGKARRRK